MSNFSDAKLEFGYFDSREAQEVLDAKVAVDAHGMTLITTRKDGGEIRWHGERRGQGHYLLIASEPNMEASLHRFADSTIFEGFWRDGVERGFWRVQLPADAVIPKEAAEASYPPGAAVKLRRPASRRRIRQAA